MSIFIFVVIICVHILLQLFKNIYIVIGVVLTAVVVCVSS
jgi:hypothetical protein